MPGYARDLRIASRYILHSKELAVKLSSSTYTKILWLSTQWVSSKSLWRIPSPYLRCVRMTLSSFVIGSVSNCCNLTTNIQKSTGENHTVPKQTDVSKQDVQNNTNSACAETSKPKVDFSIDQKVMRFREIDVLPTHLDPHLSKHK